MYRSISLATLTFLFALLSQVQGFSVVPFHQYGASYAYGEYDNIDTDDAQITVFANKIGLDVPQVSSNLLSFTVPLGTRLTGELKCTDIFGTPIPARSITLDAGLYKIRATYVKAVKAGDRVGLSCGPFTVPRTAYDVKGDYPEVDFESESRIVVRSKVARTIPPTPISSEPALVHFAKPSGQSGYMSFEFPKSFLGLDEPEVHYYLTAEFPKSTQVFNPASEDRDWRHATDSNDPERNYVISTYLTPLHHIKQMRMDFFLGKTVAQGEKFEIRIPGIISPAYAGDSSQKIKVKLYGKNEKIIAVQTLTSVVDNSL